MTLAERLSEYVRACFTGIWIESHEHHDALAEISQLCRAESWSLATWDIESGLAVAGQVAAAGTDPLAAIRSINAVATPEGTAILVLQNFHRFTQSAEIVQALAQQIVTGKQNRTFVVVLSPIVQIPVELEKLFAVVEHELPDRAQLAGIAEGIATEPGELPAGAEHERILDAAVGLTRYEAEAAFSLSLVREGRLTAATLWEQKSQMLKKSGLLSLYRGGEDFSCLGGLTALKAFCKRSLLPRRRENPVVRPRGVLLLSPPGCGKSQFCKSLGKEVGRPVLNLDVGSLMGSLVGQSEERTRQALRIWPSGSSDDERCHSRDSPPLSISESCRAVRPRFDFALAARTLVSGFRWATPDRGHFLWELGEWARPDSSSPDLACRRSY